MLGHRLSVAVIAVPAILCVAGCGSGPRFARVSGVVTLNGKPYSRACVTFQPVGDSTNPNPGPGSSADTDENGRFVLMASQGQRGAVVGKHRVSIGTRCVFLASAPGWDYTKAMPEGIELADPIPIRWRGGNMVFTVPACGTDAANFELSYLDR